MKKGIPENDPPGDLPADVAGLKGWAKARQTVDLSRVKLPSRRITINIDSDIIAIFKAEALRGGPPYQVAINQALREHLHRKERQGKREAVRVLLAALDDPAVRRKIKILARKA